MIIRKLHGTIASARVLSMNQLGLLVRKKFAGVAISLANLDQLPWLKTTILVQLSHQRGLQRHYQLPSALSQPLKKKALIRIGDSQFRMALGLHHLSKLFGPGLGCL